MEEEFKFLSPAPWPRISDQDAPLRSHVVRLKGDVLLGYTSQFDESFLDVAVQVFDKLILGHLEYRCIAC